MSFCSSPRISSSESTGFPRPCASMSAFFNAALTSRSVDTRRSSRAFIASLRAVLISSRSTAMASRKIAPESGSSRRARDRRRAPRLRLSMSEKQPAHSGGDHAKPAGAEPKPSAVLVLADGTVFEGAGFGATGHAVGEVCFNTSMTGYQEIITDPSYAGQIITFTFPHIGNVGTNAEDIESINPAAPGVVLRGDITEPANWRAAKPLDDWLKSHNLPGVCGVDS